jgi:hypothetical protein
LRRKDKIGERGATAAGAGCQYHRTMTMHCDADSAASPEAALDRRIFLRMATAALVAFATAPARAAELNTASGVAIGGYDPVAYFTDGRPVRGSRRHRLEWNGAWWFFASDGHRAAFAADPGRYAPRYGGFCAYGVAQNVKVKIDPAAWSIVEGRLYLNYDRKVRQTWLEDPAGYIGTADRNWPALDGK